MTFLYLAVAKSQRCSGRMSQEGQLLLEDNVHTDADAHANTPTSTSKSAAQEREESHGAGSNTSQVGK